jgi:hypothetical protein
MTILCLFASANTSLVSRSFKVNAFSHNTCFLPGWHQEHFVCGRHGAFPYKHFQCLYHCISLHNFRRCSGYGQAHVDLQIPGPCLPIRNQWLGWCGLPFCSLDQLSHDEIMPVPGKAHRITGSSLLVMEREQNYLATSK